MPKPKSLRKNPFVITSCILVIVVIVLLGLIMRKQCPSSLERKISAQPTFLYVQTARSGTLSSEQEGGKRTLKLYDASPVTTYFSERPNRVTGHEPTEEFISKWGEGGDGFADSPPNAALDIIGENSQTISIIELISAKYDASTKVLEYEIIILDDGNIPQSFGKAALFIDSTYKDYQCGCSLASDEKICKCKYEYTLGQSATKEFRGYCSNGLYPEGIHIGGKNKGTSCTHSFPWFDYYSRSCTNWDAISSDKLNITVRCTK